tara:strand:- start:1942 stop:2478 length:537 start_codon:yes stop_codon:yes gene_type:complete
MNQYQCPDCSYIYDESKGNPHEGFPAGTTWDLIPDDWSCPDCAVRDKIDFLNKQENSQRISPINKPQEQEKPQIKKGSRSKKMPPQRTQVSTSSTNSESKRTAKSKTQRASSSKISENSKVNEEFKKWVCITCGHIYDEALGDETEGFPPGTRFENIPDDWCCPDCGATKEDYVLFEG